MDALTNELDRLRRQIKIARTVERAVRWAFYASVLSCLYLTAQKFLGLSGPRAILVAALVAIPFAMAAREWARRLTLRDCAVLIDRRFRLEERVASAVEATGPMAPLLSVDANRAMQRAGASALGRLHWPRETPFFALTAVLAMVLWAIPAPDSSGAGADPALQGAARDERTKLLGVAKVPPQAGKTAAELSKEMSDIAAFLDKGTPDAVRQAIERLRAVEEKAGSRILEPGVSRGEADALRAIADRAAGSGSALIQALEQARESAPEWVLSPSIAKKLARASRDASGGLHATDRPAEFVVKKIAEAGPSEPVVRETIARALEKRDWPPRYDASVRKYFSGE